MFVVYFLADSRSGKSYLFAKITQDTNKKGNRCLILAHRNSLIRQHKELFNELDITNEMTRIESVFTEVRHLGEHGKVDLIIIDEGHLSGASSYQKVCEYYNCRVILFTGSPSRLDGKPLNLATKMIIGISAKELIKRKQISSYEYYAPDLGIDFSQVKKSQGDFNNEDLGKTMSSKKIYGDILKYYNKLCKDEQAIAYCVNINHAKEVCENFNNNGISAKEIDSKTPEKEREIIMDQFKNGEFKILCNCNLISEGTTLPNSRVCLMLRPTLSLPLFIQQACRVLNYVDDTPAKIIDFVNNVQRHGLPTMDREWSLSKPVKEYFNENDDGTFKIRVCQECFMTFETAPVCPYCGAVYETTPMEIENFKEIQLKKIEEEKEVKRQRYLNNIANKVKEYKSAKECQNWVELTQFVKEKGYRPGYAYVLAKQMKIPFGRNKK